MNNEQNNQGAFTNFRTTAIDGTNLNESSKGPIEVSRNKLGFGGIFNILVCLMFIAVGLSAVNFVVVQPLMSGAPFDESRLSVVAFFALWLSVPVYSLVRTLRPKNK